MLKIAEAAQKLLREAGAEEDAEKIRDLASTVRNQPYRVCVVGGFSRGKTRLLNRLLDTDLFPEDVAPATTTLTQVSYGSREEMEFIGATRTESFALSAENLDKFSAGSEYGDAVGLIRVSLPSPFLYPDIYIYDTPGIDDVLSERADVAFDALTRCDAALVVTSATQPLGLNEREFMDAYLANKPGAPRIALVVSWLDQLNPEQARTQLRYIKSSAAKISPEIQVWSPEENAPDADLAGVPAIRERIREWATAQDLAERRSARALGATAAILENFIKRQEALRLDLSGDLRGRENDLAQALARLREESETWIELRDRFLEAGQECAAKLRREALAEVRALAEDPKRRGDSRAELEAVAQKLATSAQETLNADVEKFAAGIREAYGIDPALNRDVTILPNVSGLNPSPAVLIPDEWLKQGVDFLEQHLDAVAQLLPLPAPLRLLAREIGRQIIKLGRNLAGPQETEEERRVALEKFSADVEKDISRAARRLYAEIAETIRRRQASWLESRRRGLEMASGKAETERELVAVAARVDAARALLEQIRQKAR